jgi:hypothetical protein
MTLDFVDIYRIHIACSIILRNVEEDIQAMGVRGWRKLSKERTEWKKITEKAKTHSGL